MPIQGTVPVGGSFAPTDAADSFGTHNDKWGVGGYRIVKTLTDRNNIPVNESNLLNLDDTLASGRRKLGMMVYVSDEDKFYVLTIPQATWNGYNEGQKVTALANNANFAEFSAGGSPLTTKGDLYTFSTLNARLPVGGNNQILAADSTEPTGLKWINVPATVTPSALTKTDDTNVTLTLGGTPSTSLLQAVSLTLGWSGTLADSRIASASNWNTAYGWGNHASVGYITTISGISAGGDLSGTYTNPTVAKIQGQPISELDPTDGQVLKWNGTTWTPGAIPTGGTGGGGVVYYLNFNTAGESPLTNIPTTPNTPKELGLVGEVTPTSYQSAHLSTGSYDFLASFVTDVSVPSSTTIPAGIWDFNIFVESSSTNAANQVYFQVKIYQYDDTEALTLLGTSSDVYIYDPTEITQYVASIIVPQITILSTDRIVVYLYGRSHQNNKHITFHFGGSYPSHVHTTLPSVTGTGFVKVIDGVYQSPATALASGDIPNNAANTTGSAATLTTSRNINGVAFNGSADITVTAAAGTLTGTTLNSTVVSSSLTSVGTIATGTWNGGIIAGQYGGTGVANTGKTITVSGNTTIGSSTNTVAFTTSANTSLALPASGTVISTVTNMAVNPITGTPSSSTFLRGDGAWATLSTTTTLTNIGAATATASLTNSNSTITWNWNSNTTGNAFVLASSSLTTGNLLDLAITSLSNTAAKGLNIAISGATANSTTYGAFISNTKSGGTSNNIALYLTASGATNNYGLIVNAGNVGIGTTTPTAWLHLGGTPTGSLPNLVLKPSTGITFSSIVNGSIWCDTVDSNTSLTMYKDSLYTKILTANRNPDFAAGSASGILVADNVGTITKSADLTALGIFSQTTTASITATGSTLTGTIVGSTTLPASFFGAGKIVKGYMSATLATGINAGTIAFSVKIGATTVCDSGNITYVISTSAEPIQVEYTITCRTSGGSGTATFQCDMRILSNGIVLGQRTILVASTATTTGINTAVTNVLDLVATISAAANTLSVLQNKAVYEN